MILSWDFVKIWKIKREITSPQKILIVDYKVWKVSKFQIPKVLTLIFINIL